MFPRQKKSVSVKKTDSIARVLQYLMYQGTGHHRTENVKSNGCLNRPCVGDVLFNTIKNLIRLQIFNIVT